MCVLTATSSSKPLAVANEDIVLDAHAGRAEVVKVLGNDVNPFPDTPLKWWTPPWRRAAPELSSPTLTTPSLSTPIPTTRAPWWCATRLPTKPRTQDRYANGRIRITVKGKPDAPTKPQIVEEKDKSVLLTWDPPADNGAPITKYTVAWAGGTQDCETNTCTITGLTNATPYKFKVTASNDVGTSAPSPESVTATPDRMPGHPGGAHHWFRRQVSHGFLGHPRGRILPRDQVQRGNFTRPAGPERPKGRD